MGTEVNSRQIKDGAVKRQDLNTATTTEAVIAKIVAGKAIEISSTGIDAGTGDVTVNLGDGNDLFWDETNKRLGLGTGTPLVPLHIENSTTGVIFRLKSTGTPTGNVVEFLNSTGQAFFSTRDDRVDINAGAAGADFNVMDDASGTLFRCDVSAGRIGVGIDTPVALIHAAAGSAGTDPAWTSGVDNMVLEASGDCWYQAFAPDANIAGYGFSTPTNLKRAYVAYVGSQDHLVFGSGSAARMWIKSDGTVAIGDNSSPQNSLSNLEILHTPADGTGADPCTLTLTNRRSSSWTDGAMMHRIDFYSRDTSGNGAGVKAQIATVLSGTSGGALGINFSLDAGSGLTDVFRLDKDLRFQAGSLSQTGTAKFNVFTSSTSQPAFFGLMKASFANEIIRIVDSSINELFYVDNGSNMFLKGGVLKFDSSETTGSGTVAFGSSDTSKAITFDNAMDDANYVVSVQVAWATSVYITSQTANGFTINVGSAHFGSGNETVKWSIRPH